MEVHDILREAIDILRLGWSQNASARDAGGVPVPPFTGDVAAVAWRELGIDATDALRAARGPDL
jgi:hypothetical protein